MIRPCSILFFIITLLNISCRNSGNDFQKPTATKHGLLILNARACNFNDVNTIEKKIKIIINNPKDIQLTQINTIMKFAGLPQNFIIYRGNIPTAIATIINNQRLIIINNDLFASQTVDSAYWVSLFIIAHEIGHHLAYNLSDTANSIKAELDADIFAGSILYRMGADSNQVLTATSKLISNTIDTKSHPSKFKRLEAIKKSWLTAFKLRYQSVTPPPLDDNLKVKEFTDKNLIFNGAVRGMFRIDLENQNDTIRSNMVKFLSTPVLKNMEGIIMNVDEVMGIVQDYEKNVIKLNLDVLVTKIDTTNQNINWLGSSMIANKMYKFEVWYEPISNTDKTIDFNRFFIIGRRFEFDIVNFFYTENELGIFPSNISRAKAIYKTYSAYMNQP